MRIDIWSDAICPFCLIAKVELDKAIATFPHRDEVTLVRRTLAIHADVPVEPIPAYLNRKYGWSAAQIASQCDAIAARAASLGLVYNWRQATSAPTLDTHRLIAYAETVGLGAEVERAITLAHFTDGRDISDHTVLNDIARAHRLDADAVDHVLASDEFADVVAADAAEAHAMGVTGTPFTLLDGEYGVSGAQSSEAFASALAQVWAIRHPA